MDLDSRCFLFYFDGFISYNFPQDLREHALGMLQTGRKACHRCYRGYCL